MSRTKNLRIFQKVSLTALLLGSFVLVGTGCGKKKNTEDVGDIIAQEYEDYERKNSDKVNQPIPTATTSPDQSETEPVQEGTKSNRQSTSTSSGEGSSRKSLLQEDSERNENYEYHSILEEDRERNENYEYHSILEEDSERNRKNAEEKQQQEKNKPTPTPTVQNNQEGKSYTKTY